VGFFDNNTVLKKIAVTGGPATTIAQLDNASRGATWAPDDTIIFSTANPATGLRRVAASGGAITVLTRPDHNRGESDHVLPTMLPGGRAVLFTVTAITGGPDASQVAVLDLKTGTHKVIVPGGSDARYVSGHLLYAVGGGTLRAIAFDPVRLETRGSTVPVAAQVTISAFVIADMAVAADGTFAYVSDAGRGASGRTLMWVDRSGREAALPTPSRWYGYPRISPDGSRLSVNAFEGDFDLWLWDFARMTLTRSTFDPALDQHQVWTPDGRRLVFSSDRGGGRNVFLQSADGTGTTEQLTQSLNVKNVTAMVPDGTAVIFDEVSEATAADVMQLSLDTAHRVTPLVRTSFNERNGVVSPDQRWLAYEANDSGQTEIYVRPYPDVNRGHWQVSNGGGTRPLWAPNGQELFYASSSGALMRVSVERGQTWSSTPPTQLIKEGYFTVPVGNPGRTYDVSRDGQRFLMIKQSGAGADTPPQIVVIQHFDEELKRLVPAK
jgi:serine/threonine-protein kinase